VAPVPASTSSTWTGGAERVTPVEIVVGRVGRAHGIRGEVRVESRTDSADLRYAVGAVLRPDGGDREVLTVRAVRFQRGTLLVRFAEVDDRTAAEALLGVTLYADVPGDERPDDAEEFYDRQLIGLWARTPDGGTIGSVVDVLHLPGQEVLVVGKSDGAEALVPFVRDLVPSVDLDSAVVVIDDRPGLLEET
jgi:16S rRNA processing protein RimM